MRSFVFVCVARSQHFNKFSFWKFSNLRASIQISFQWEVICSPFHWNRPRNKKVAFALTQHSKKWTGATTLYCAPAPQLSDSWAMLEWSRLPGAIDLRHKTWRGSSFLRQTWICEHTACVIILVDYYHSRSVGLRPMCLSKTTKPDYINVIVNYLLCVFLRISFNIGWHIMSN